VLVWAAFSWAPTDRLAVQASIEKLTREIEVAAIEFWTVRAGFNRVASALGYRSREDRWNGRPITVWRKQL